MGAGAIRAGRAFVELFVDDSKMQGTLQRTRQKMQKWGAALGAIGAGITTAFLGAANAFAKAGDRLDKMSKRTGVSVEALSALDFAASQSGTSLEAVEKGILGMSRNLLDAERGLSTATDNFSDLGISLQQLEDLSTEEKFLLITERLSEIDDESRRSALAMKFFGKSGAQLLPLLENGADGIRSMMDEAKALGIVMSTEDAVAAAKLTDEIDKLTRQFKQIVVEIGGAVAPVLTDLAPQLGDMAKGVAEWARENPKLFQTLLKIGGVLAVGGPIIAGLGTVIGLLTGPAGIVASIAAVAAAPVLAIRGVDQTIDDLKAILQLLGLIEDNDLTRDLGTAPPPGSVLDARERGGAIRPGQIEAERKAARDKQQREALANEKQQAESRAALERTAAKARERKAREAAERERLEQQRIAAERAQAASQAFAAASQTSLSSFASGTTAGRNLIRDALTGRRSKQETLLAKSNQLLRDIDRKLAAGPVIASTEAPA